MDGTKTGRFYGDPHGQFVGALKAAGEAAGMDFSKPYEDLAEAERDIALHGTGDRVYDIVWSYKRGNRAGDFAFRGPWKGFAALVAEEYGRKHADHRGEAMRVLMRDDPCPGLRREAAEARVARRDLPGARHRRPLRAHRGRVDRLLRGRGRRRAGGRAVAGRDGGRARRDPAPAPASSATSAWTTSASTGPRPRLSGGEAQRLRLAGLLGVRLTGVTFVLDEPTLGLHPRDTAKLVDLIRGLTAEGNTVVAVEHDLDVVRAADHVLDLGPGAGREGGRIVAEGTPREIESARRFGDRTLSRGPRRSGRACSRDLPDRRSRSSGPGPTISARSMSPSPPGS
ncbi:MAG: hypothetical protein MZU84_08585 [Sphingobacterium sp.]|nr:hypothetical protein [Sphingobacterium sp.]